MRRKLVRLFLMSSFSPNASWITTTPCHGPGAAPAGGTARYPRVGAVGYLVGNALACGKHCHTLRHCGIQAPSVTG